MNGIPSKPSICFGVPSLDDLFGTFSLSHRAYGVPVEGDEQTNLTLVGPDGSGKSLLAFHLASRYAADSFSRAKDALSRAKKDTKASPALFLPIVLYISTDLTLAKARKTWKAFRLDRPNLREIPFHHGTVKSESDLQVNAEDVNLPVPLISLDPTHQEPPPSEDPPPSSKTAANKQSQTDKEAENGEANGEKSQSLAEYIIECGEPRTDISVGFIDLIRHPVGDLWSFATRLLASLPAKNPEQHLVIVDNVDGFEVLMGEVNAYGDRSSPRARIMQVVRAAAGRAHLAFVSEEGGSGATPLRDISDVVVRLRIQEESGYRYRSIEIEKARAQAIHRGDHYFMIRTGSGSTTGTQENPDEPRTANAYLQVITSINTLSRRSMNEPAVLIPGPAINRTKRAGFGLEALDELCGAGLETDSGPLKNDTEGLQYGSLTAILGDSNTHKTPLAERFLLRGFELFAQNLNTLYKDSRVRPGPESELQKLVDAIAPPKPSAEPQPDESAPESKEKFQKQLQSAFDASDRQIGFLSLLLLSGKTGSEPNWGPGEIEREIEKSLSEQKLTSSLAFITGRWAARILKNRLKDQLDLVDRQLERDLVRACLPDPIFDGEFADLLTSGQGVTCQQYVAAAIRIWLTDFKAGHYEHHSPAVAVQYEIRHEYMMTKAERAALVRKVIGARPKPRGAAAAAPATIDTSSSPINTLDDELQEQARNNEKLWKSDSALKFLQIRFPGSCDYLTAEQRRTLTGAFNAEFLLDGETLTRLFVGAAIRNVDSYGPNQGELKEWLRRLDLWSEDTPSSIQSFGGKLINFASAATRPDRAAIYELVKYLNPPKTQHADWRSVLRQSVPHLPDYQKLQADWPEEFASWLFEFSPNTHPYAFNNGKQSLKIELQALAGKHEERDSLSRPTFCSAMVAAVLQMVRLGKLSFKGHLDDELRARRLATENLQHLHAWVETYLPWENKDQESECGRAFRNFCSFTKGRELKADHVIEFVKAICKRRRLDIDLSKDDLLSAKRLQVCRLLLEAAARRGLCDGPAILISTNDTRWQLFKEKYVRWLERFLVREKYSERNAAEFKLLAEDHLREWLIIRRLEVHYLGTPTLAAIIRRCEITAQGLIFATPPTSDQNFEKRYAWMADINLRRTRSWCIRLAIDGLTSLRNTHRNVEEDRLFLPSLRFSIGWENLTGIVVVSQSGRPDSTGADRFEREAIDLFLNQIRTWRVRFYGELRVAVTTLPPSPEQSSARIREISTGADGELQINPHFEQYKGLETDQPERVGLEVRLIGDSPVWQAYRSELNEVLADVFEPAEQAKQSKQIVLAEKTQGWTEKLRDFARLHRGTHLDHTLILQVDEFWGFQRSEALRNEYRFFNATCSSEQRGYGNDPLQMFQATLADPEPVSASRRHQNFLWNGFYRTDEDEPWTPAERQHVDRVPFLWDFGFLLCNREAWEAAKQESLRVLKTKHSPVDRDEPFTVNDVWSSFEKIPAVKTSDPKLAGKDLAQARSWRLFMEAAALTASHHALSTAGPSPAFDLAVRNGESLSCLILEIWASEVYRKFERRSEDLEEPYFARFTKRSWAPALTRGLIGLIAEPESKGDLKRIYGRAMAAGRLPELARHSLEFFKALLLISEALDIASFVDVKHSLKLESRAVHVEAVAARHWYGTACEFFETSASADRFIPMRLPGHFSVRGDWFLAVAKGSRSSLLADRALDLLSSRRGNFDRLRLGLGLPVRDVAPITDANPQTRLTANLQNGHRDWVLYKDLLALGANEDQTDNFHWLWRSSLGDYDAQDRAFQQGLLLLLNWWKNLRVDRVPDWKGGFALYDAIDRYQVASDPGERRDIFDKHFAVNSLWQFPEVCDELVRTLKRATPRR